MVISREKAKKIGSIDSIVNNKKNTLLLPKCQKLLSYATKYSLGKSSFLSFNTFTFDPIFFFLDLTIYFTLL